MLQDVLAKNCNALAAPPGGELLEYNVSGEREACVPCGAGSGFDVSLREHARAEDRTAGADTGDRANAGSLWLPQDPCAAEPGGLESGKKAGVSPLSGRRLDAATHDSIIRLFKNEPGVLRMSPPKRRGVRTRTTYRSPWWLRCMSDAGTSRPIAGIAA
jgi:hypothetical protein